MNIFFTYDSSIFVGGFILLQETKLTLLVNFRLIFRENSTVHSIPHLNSVSMLEINSFKCSIGQVICSSLPGGSSLRGTRLSSLILRYLVF